MLKFVHIFSRVIFFLQNIVILGFWGLFFIGGFIFILSSDNGSIFIKDLISLSIIPAFLLCVFWGVYKLLNTYQVKYAALIYLIVAIPCIGISEYNLGLNSPFTYIFSQINNIKEVDQVKLPIEVAIIEEVDTTSKSNKNLRFKFNITNNNDGIFDYEFYLKDENGNNNIYCNPYNKLMHGSGTLEFSCFSKCSKQALNKKEGFTGTMCQISNYKKLASAVLVFYKIRDKPILLVNAGEENIYIKTQSFPIENTDVFSEYYYQSVNQN